MLYQSKHNGIVVDVTKPPYCADNTGKVDCTEILCRVLDDILVREIDGVQKIRTKLLEDPRDNFRLGFENRKMGGVPTVIFPEDPPAARIIYLPAGTYLISDTITYSFENLKNLINDRPSSDLDRFIRFKGEGMDKTVIKLQDHCHAFRYGENKPMVSFVRSNGSNVAMMNSFEDITLDIGSGNSGAVGLRFHSNNTGKIENVNIISSDEQHRGYAAILMDLEQENIAKNIRIDGFEYGILVTDPGPSHCFENIEMDHILRTGIRTERAVVAVRRATIRTYGSAVTPYFTSMLALLDSTVIRLGEKGGTAIRPYDAWCYLRHVKIENFHDAVTNDYETVYEGDCEIAEYNNAKRDDSLFPGGRFELPVEEQPVYEWNGDRDIVAEVDDFGAKGDGITDSTAAIRQAMNSGKEYIVFGEGRYLVSGEITIPASVKAINFMYCDFALDPAFAEEKDKGLFAITEDSDDILYMDDAFVFEKFYGYLRFIRHSAKRDLAVSDVHVQTGAFYYNTVGGSKVYLENTASTMGVFGGIGYGSVPCFRFSDGQKVWARQFNPERSADNCLAEGGSDLWVFGFKTEGPAGKGFNIRGGSRMEVFVGTAAIATDDGTPCIENENSSVFAYLRTDGCGPHHQFTVAVKETQGSETHYLPATAMPKYGPEYYFIPGYHGIKQ
jgi:hypothetical protein